MSDALATILNVNDHEQTRYMVTRMLRMAGFDVIEAACGEDALRLASMQPDVIVLDVKLPDISGFEVCRMLKSRPEFASIFILQTSATFVTTSKKVEGLDSGADGYLTHPFDPSELVAQIKSMLRLRRVETALRARAEELSEADRRKDEFLAMLAHELRNPLAAMASAVPLIMRYRNDEARLARVSGVLDRQTKHLARLIDDLLDVSRITRGRIELRRDTIDVGAVVADAGETASAMLAKREQALVVDVPETRLFVDGDAARLQQVVSNLVDNASKYTDRGGKISLTLAPRRRGDEDGLSFRVRDSGIGMKAELVPHVFELFVQADDSLARSRGGMGIGLTLVQRLVILHGGTIEARSEGLGHGSEFEIWLPLTSRRPEPVAPPSEPQMKQARTCSILLVEDNEDAREMLASFLVEAGHDVAFAADGVTGVQKAITEKHDVAIVDIGLPGLDGYEVAERIRAQVRRRIRLIALTGYGGTEPRRRALGAGFDRHLVKPIDPDLLLQVVNEVCEESPASPGAEE